MVNEQDNQGGGEGVSGDFSERIQFILGLLSSTFKKHILDPIVIG